MEWNYCMNEAPRNTPLKLLSSDDDLLLPQRVYVGTISTSYNGKYIIKGECIDGDPDYFFSSSIIAWKPIEGGEKMSKYEVGDKFIIEIDKKYITRDGNVLYKVFGFNSLVFDDNGLNKLIPYEEKPKITNAEKFKEIFGESLPEWYVNVKSSLAFDTWCKNRYEGE